MNYEIVEFNLHFKQMPSGFQSPPGANYSKNRFITLQFSSIKDSLEGRKYILEYLEWSEDYPDHSGHLSS